MRRCLASSNILLRATTFRNARGLDTRRHSVIVMTFTSASWTRSSLSESSPMIRRTWASSLGLKGITMCLNQYCRSASSGSALAACSLDRIMKLHPCRPIFVLRHVASVITAANAALRRAGARLMSTLPDGNGSLEDRTAGWIVRGRSAQENGKNRHAPRRPHPHAAKTTCRSRFLTCIDSRPAPYSRIEKPCLWNRSSR